jgi:hypothetical protein
MSRTAHRAVPLLSVVALWLTACGSRTLPGSTALGPRDAEPDTTVPVDAADAGDPFYTCTDDAGRVDCNATSTPFDRGGAACALALVPVSVCRQPNDPSGAGHVTVTFAPSGNVIFAEIDQPPFKGTSTGTCLVALFMKVKIAPYCGGNIPVGKSFLIE